MHIHCLSLSLNTQLQTNFVLLGRFDSDFVIFLGYAAHALGDPSVTVEQVTPPVFPSGALLPPEVHINSIS